MATYVESNKIELKRELTADCKKAIIALTNTDGGTLYIVWTTAAMCSA